MEAPVATTATSYWCSTLRISFGVTSVPSRTSMPSFFVITS